MKFIGYINTIGRVFFNELRTIFRDGGAILLFVIANFAYPVIYSFAYSNENVFDLPVCVVDFDNTSTSRSLIKMADETPELSIERSAASLQEAKEMFNRGEVNAIVRIPKDFEKKILKSESSPVSLYCDGAYFMYYKLAQKALLSSSNTLAAGIEVKKLLAKGENINQATTSVFPIKVDIFEEYNPGGGYGSFVMPGMIFLILQQTLLIGIGLLGGTRRENNSFRFYRVFCNTRGGISSLVLGKSLAYVMVYVFNFMLSLVVINHMFGFPFRGGFVSELLLLVPFLFAVSFMGLAISTLFRSRVHSLMFLVFLSPILLFLSGLSWPKDSIPEVLQWFSSLFPTEYGIPAFLRLRVMGVGFESISFEFFAILVQMIIYFFLACYAYKRLIIKS